MKITFSLSFFLLLISSSLNSQDKELFEKQLFISGEDTLPCRILTPINFDASKKYPLLIFLHGAGERGNDNKAQLTWGADLFLDSTNRIKFPAIVIFPQCPSNDKWSEYNKNSLKDSTGYEYSEVAAMRKSLKLVSDFIDTLLQSNQVDKKRVYIGGLSMGGFGTLELLWRRPQTFAAAFPICGATNPNKLKDYRKNLPIWIFHGDKDAVINVSNSRLIYGILKKTNPNAKYTEYAGVNHDSWKNAFAEPSLLSWLFAQKLTSVK
ncbi:MAG: prolyl oligopeptidase family serine peptidase [Chitinophagaceae bacterium]